MHCASVRTSIRQSCRNLIKSLITGNLKDEGAPCQIFVDYAGSGKGVVITAFVNGDLYVDASDGQGMFNTRGFGLNVERIGAKFRAVLAKPAPSSETAVLRHD